MSLEQHRTESSRRKSVRTALKVGVMTGSILTASLIVVAQPPEPQQVSERTTSKAVAGETFRYTSGQYLGATTCASSNCHGNIDPIRGSKVLQNEFLTWLDADPHSEAYTALYDEDSLLIAKNMRLEQPPHRAQVCLACHTMNVPAGLQAQPIEADEGISCESCHGAAGGWFEGHVQSDWTYQDSVRAGLVDLRNVSRRSSVCLSCHLGAEGRSVDHELIAAGHPELVFELDNFTGALPRHWQHYENRHGVRAWAIGQVASFRAGMEQLSRRAESGRWPEFSEMNCSSCHHSLDGAQWRQVRGYQFRAGLPPWSPARWVVLRQLVKRMAPESLEGLGENVDRVAVTVAHMNRPAETAEAASAIAKALGPVLAEMQSRDFDQESVTALLHAITTDTEAVSSDIQSAEQVYLTINTLVSYMARVDGSILRGPIAQALAAIDRLMQSRHRFDWVSFNRELAKIATATAAS